MAKIDRVVLDVPARGEYARTVRLVAAEIAARLGMSVDEVDDVRLAVEEAFVYAVGHPGLDTVTCTFSLMPDSMELQIGPLPHRCVEPEKHDASGRYARFILDAMCDEFELDERDDGCYVRLLKRTA